MDKDFETRVQESFSRQAFMQLIGAELTDVQPGYCEIRVPYKKELTQQHGYFHAGVVGAIADNVGGYAAYSLMDASSSILTVEYKLNLVAPAKGSMLIARSEVLKEGKTLTVCRCEVYSMERGKEVLCAVSQMTLIELKHPADI